MIACPTCQATVDGGSGAAGGSLTCPRCGRSLARAGAGANPFAAPTSEIGEDRGPMAVPVGFGAKVAAAFRRAGDEAVTADLAEDAPRAGLDPLAAFAGQGFDLVFSIGLFGELRDGAGRTAAQIVGAPHVVQYVDYPLSHYPRLDATPPETALLTVDPTHVDAVRSAYGPERFAHVAFSPHGGSCCNLRLGQCSCR